MKQRSPRLGATLISCGLLGAAFAAHGADGSESLSAQGVTAQEALQQQPTPSDSLTGAQAGGQAAPAAAIAEVVVTAQRRKQSLQKAAVAVTAVGEGQLIQQGARSVVDVAAMVPSLQISQTGQIALRGVGTPSTSENADPTVAPHVDGIYIARPVAMLGAGLFDVERVEVLRGPQGTLYGRNATAGSMNIITRQPEFATEGSLATEFGNYDLKLLSGMANVALSDVLALRVAAQTNSHSGYIASGNIRTPATDSADTASARVSLLYKPSRDWSALVRIDSTRDTGNSYQYGTVPVAADGKALRASAAILPAWNDGRYNGASLEMNWLLGPGNLTYVGARRRTATDQLTQLVAYDIPLRSKSTDVTDQQELRYVGDLGKFNFVTGLFYFKEENTVDFRANFGGCCAYENQVDNKSFALYGQGTYRLTDRLRTTLGLRRTHDKKSRTGGGFALDGDFNIGGSISPSDSFGDWRRTNYKVGVEFDVGNNSMLFANLSTGYKAGGANDNSTVYDPESIKAWELGWKNRFLDNRLTLNLDVFNYDYSALQLQRYMVGTVVTLNAGKAYSRGIELEGSYRPTADDQFDFSVGAMRARYSDFVEVAGNTAADVRDYSGNRLAKAPPVTVNLGYQHVFTVGTGTLTARAQTHYEAAKYMDYSNIASSRQRAYTRSDVVLTYAPADARWKLMAYARNLENKVVMTDFFVTNGAAHGVLANIAAPLTTGLRLDVFF
nr:TonB-dependent receptor [uncultured Duganella sp.]